MALTDNKAKIQALIAGINALPEAGSGEAPAPVLQEKTVTPTKETQSITPDTGYDGLSKVNVNAIPDEYVIPTGEKSIAENGKHDVAGYASVDVNVPSEEAKLQEKTVCPSTAAQEVTPDSGYDGLSKVTVEAVETVEQATPEISVSADGLISATSAQDEGYIAVTGMKTATKQLDTQGTQTITPGTADQTIAYGKYLTGTQTIKGDSNLVAGNIKSGVSIFGVAGSFEGSSGSGGDSGGELCTLRITKYDTWYIEMLLYNNGTAWQRIETPESENYQITVLSGTSIILAYVERIFSGVGNEADYMRLSGGISMPNQETGSTFVFDINGDAWLELL